MSLLIQVNQTVIKEKIPRVKKKRKENYDLVKVKSKTPDLYPTENL